MSIFFSPAALPTIQQKTTIALINHQRNLLWTLRIIREVYFGPYESSEKPYFGPYESPEKATLDLTND